jgi:hypothetical protein
MLVNWSKHTSVWYCTVWDMLLVFCCGMNCITNIRTICRTILAYSAIENMNGILNVVDCTKTELAVGCSYKLQWLLYWLAGWVRSKKGLELPVISLYMSIITCQLVVAWVVMHSLQENVKKKKKHIAITLKNRIHAFELQMPMKSFAAVMSTTLETSYVFTHLFKIRNITAAWCWQWMKYLREEYDFCSIWWSVYVFNKLTYYIVIWNLNVMLLSYFLYSLLFYRMYGEALICEFCTQEEYHVCLFHTT